MYGFCRRNIVTPHERKRCSLPVGITSDSFRGYPTTSTTTQATHSLTPLAVVRPNFGRNSIECGNFSIGGSVKKILFLFVVLLSAAVLNTIAATNWTKAEVIKIEPERHRIVLKHEAIQSIGMDAMTMLFDVASKVPLKQYRVGDKVRFQVKINDGVLEVIALEKMR